MTEAGESKRKHSGRRTGAPATRDQILAAARASFAEHGYERTTIRGIASDAAVDPALVMHYFGSKEKLLFASIALVVAPAEAMPALLAGSREDLGERFVRSFLGLWEDAETRQALAGMVRAAVSREEAASLLRSFLGDEIIRPLAAGLEGSDRERRAILVASQLIGIALHRYIVKVEPLASADFESIVASVAPTIQRYVSGE